MLTNIRDQLAHWAKKFGRFAFKTKLRGIFTLIAALVLVILTVQQLLPANGIMHKRYRIGRDNWWPSSVFSGRERNFEGFSNELFAHISKFEKVTFEFITWNSAQLVQGLEQGQVDGIVSLIPPTPMNERYYDFSEPLLLLGPVLIVREDSTARSLVDMSGKTIAIRTGASLVFNYLNDLMGNKSPPVYTTFDNMTDALDQLANNQIDGVIMETMPAYTITDGYYKGKLKVATTPLTWEGIRVLGLLSKEHSRQMIEHIDHGLTKLHQDGTYDQLIEKWGLIDPTRLKR